MSTYRELHKLALWYPCPYCRADADQWCTTKGGHRSSYLHTSRQHGVWQAHVRGYAEGVVDAAAMSPADLRKWSVYYEPVLS